MNYAKVMDNKSKERSEVDRRQFSFTFHIPERRSGIDRRSNLERNNVCFLHIDGKKREKAFK